jgi:hypothetical protein
MQCCARNGTPLKPPQRSHAMHECHTTLHPENSTVHTLYSTPDFRLQAPGARPKKSILPQATTGARKCPVKPPHFNPLWATRSGIPISPISHWGTHWTPRRPETNRTGYQHSFVQQSNQVP